MLKRLISCTIALFMLFSLGLASYADSVGEGVLLTDEEIEAGTVYFYDSSEIIVSKEDFTEEEKQLLLANLFEAEISEVTYVIKNGLLTCEEVTQYYLDRIDTYNKDFNCFITLMGEQALARARELDERLAKGECEGILFGVPIVVKDNIDVAGVYTTNGYSFANSYIADENAAIVDKMLAQGAVILGKTNMSVAAQSARYSYSRTIGQTYNAYSHELTSGGSSGGTAVAVSTNLCVAGLGTDTNSSLRIPAAMNGCVSLRFTSGVLDREGIVILNRTRDVPGAITRTVKDTAIMADILTDFKNNYVEKLDENALTGVRIGVLKELVKRYYSDKENEKAFADALKELEDLGAILVEVSLPGVFTYSAQTEAGVTGSTQAFLNAYNSMLKKYDVEAVVYPAYLSTPFSSAMNKGGMVANTQAWVNNARPLASAIGIPEISVPIGNHSLGAGLGMEISSAKNNEALLLSLAYSYTEHNNHRSVPDNTYSAMEVSKDGKSSKEIYDAVYERLETAARMLSEERKNNAVDTIFASVKEETANQISLAVKGYHLKELMPVNIKAIEMEKKIELYSALFVAFVLLFILAFPFAGLIKSRAEKIRFKAKPDADKVELEEIM